MIGPTYIYNATVIDIHDGDTITVDFDLGLNTWLKNEKIRLLGINAPELITVAGKASLVALQTQLSVGDVVVIKTVPASSITTDDKKEKYGRWLGTIYKGGIDLNQWMLDNGYAVPDAG